MKEDPVKKAMEQFAHENTPEEDAKVLEILKSRVGLPKPTKEERKAFYREFFKI